MALKDYLGLAGDFLSSGLSTIGGFIANRQNAKENEKNRQWNEKMWNLANQYNLPVNQMSRLKDAGLNPNLVYGDGTSTLASYAGNLGTQKANENPMSNVRLNSADVVRLQNETKVADATEFEKNTTANKNIAEAEYYEEQSNLLKTENQYRGKMLQNELEKRGIELSNLDIENTIKLATQNTEIALRLTELEKLAADKEISSAQVKIKAQELLNLAEELENLKKTGQFIEAQTKTEEHKQSALDAEAEASRASAQASKAVAAYNHALVSLTPYQKKMIKGQTKSYLADAFMKTANGKLDKYKAWQVANEVEEAFANGNLQRALDSINKLKGEFGGIINSADYVQKLIKGIQQLPASQRGWSDFSKFQF